MSTTNDLLEEQRARLREELRVFSEQTKDARMYEELTNKSLELNNIKDTELCTEAYRDLANQVEQCNINYGGEGLGAYESLEADFQKTSDIHVRAYETSIENVDMKDADIDLEGFMEDYELDALGDDIVAEAEVRGPDSVVLQNDYGSVTLHPDVYEDYVSLAENPELQKMLINPLATNEEIADFKEQLDLAEEWGLQPEERAKLENDYAATNELLDANEGHPQNVRKEMLDNVKGDIAKAEQGWDKVRAEALDKNPHLTATELGEMKSEYIKKLNWDKTCEKSRDILQKGAQLDKVQFGKDEQAAFEALKEAQSKGASIASIGKGVVDVGAGLMGAMAAGDEVQAFSQLAKTMGNAAKKIFDLFASKKKSVAQALKLLKEGDITKETYKTQTFEQAKAIKPEELQKSQMEMHRNLEGCVQRSARDGIKIDLENKMPNGDKYTFEIRPTAKTNGVKSANVTLKHNGKAISQGQTKDVMKKYTQTVTQQAQKAGQEAAKAAAKAGKEAAKAAGQTAAKGAACTNPYSAAAQVAKEAMKKGIQILKNEKTVDLTER